MRAQGPSPPRRPHIEHYRALWKNASPCIGGAPPLSSRCRYHGLPELPGHPLGACAKRRPHATRPRRSELGALHLTPDSRLPTPDSELLSLVLLLSLVSDYASQTSHRGH